MDGKLDIFTLIFVVLAVVVILKLRSVLGRRTNDDEARQKRYDEQARAAAAEARDKVVMMPRRQGPTADTATENPATAATTLADAEQKIRAFAAGNVRLATDLMRIIDHLLHPRKNSVKAGQTGVRQLRTLSGIYAD